MLLEEQQSQAIGGITGADVVICLQVISRLVSTGNIQDAELAAVGTARNNLVKKLEDATGVNFDQVRAQQQQAAREAQAARQQAAQEAQATQAAPVVNTPEVVVNPEVVDDAPDMVADDTAPEQAAG